jgi:uncharacterized protein YcnI
MNRFALTTVALAAGATLALAAPLAASAHVTLDGNTAAAGSYSLLTFKVPNESATEATSRIQLTLPAETPLESVSYVPVAGWTTEVTESTVTWTAEPGSEIAAGQLLLLPLSVGPIPDTGSIVLPVDQTYTDGTVVSWSETEEDAEHPAPVLYVNDAPAADHHADDDGDDASIDATETDAAGSATAATSDVLARVLGIGGLVLGVVALVIAIATRRARAAN